MDAADVIEAKASAKRFDERAAELQEEMDEAEATATYPVTHLAYDETGGFELSRGRRGAREGVHVLAGGPRNTAIRGARRARGEQQATALNA